MAALLSINQAAWPNIERGDEQAPAFGVEPKVVMGEADRAMRFAEAQGGSCSGAADVLAAAVLGKQAVAALGERGKRCCGDTTAKAGAEQAVGASIAWPVRTPANTALTPVNLAEMIGIGQSPISAAANGTGALRGSNRRDEWRQWMGKLAWPCERGGSRGAKCGLRSSDILPRSKWG